VYRRHSIVDLALRGILVALLFVVVPLLIFRALENFAYYVHNTGLERALSALYAPVIATSCMAALAVLLERVSLICVQSGRERVALILGLITNIAAASALSIVIYIALSRVVAAPYVCAFIAGIVAVSILYAVSINFDRYLTNMFSSSIIYASSITLILPALLRALGNLSYVLYVPSIIPMIAALSEKRESMRKVGPVIALAVLLLSMLALYMFTIRHVALALARRGETFLGYVLDALAISLILSICLIIINVLFRGERPLIIENVSPFEKIIELKLDSLSRTVYKRMKEFLETGNKVPLLCSIVEIGRFLDNVNNLEKAIKIVEEYSDLKAPALSLGWQTEMIKYRNYVRRLALVKAVVDILKGEKTTEEQLKKISSQILRNVPQISPAGVISRVAIVLLIAIPFLSAIFRVYATVYALPIVVLLILLLSDTAVFPRRHLVKQLVHTYNRYMSLLR